LNSSFGDSETRPVLTFRFDINTGEAREITAWLVLCKLESTCFVVVCFELKLKKKAVQDSFPRTKVDLLITFRDLCRS